jgi:release factor glutamine methyltransferase
MTLQDHVARARERLREAGIRAEEAARDAELLARHVLGWDRAAYLTRRDLPAPSTFEDAFEPLVARRERREPAPLILGRREFWGLDFEITSDVLSPRPETELVVEQAAGLARAMEAPLVVDVGTGSGCIAVSLAGELPRAAIIATDISTAALAVARRNAARHGVDGRIDFRLADLLDGVPERPDLIVSNPPYVPAASARALAPEVRDHEPAIALFGTGQDGTGTIRALVAAAADRLAPGGFLVFEFGYGQDEAVAALAPGTLTLETIGEDLQGIPRIAVFRRSR